MTSNIKLAIYTHWLDIFPTASVSVLLTNFCKYISKHPDIDLSLLHHKRVTTEIYQYGKSIIIPTMPFVGEFVLSQHNFFDVLQFPLIPFEYRIASPFVLHSKTIAWVHGISDELRINGNVSLVRQMIQRALEMVVARKITRIVITSHSFEERFIKYLGLSNSKVKVIYNPIDTDFRFIEDRNSLKPIQEKYNLQKKYILSVSLYSPRKNPNTLFQVAKYLAQDNDLNLVIAGDGWNESGEVKKLISNYGIVDRVRLLGRVPLPDLVQLYNLAEVFFLPSYHENFGIPNVEAMACGTPVVSSNIYSIPEITGGAAMLFDPEDVNGYIQAIKRIISNSILINELREKGFINRNRFTWDNVVNQFIALYYELSPRVK